MWEAYVLAFAVTAAVADLLWRRIPFALTALGVITGLIYHLFLGEIGSSAAAAAVGFGVGLALFQLRAVGGGDVKLITALGALLGWAHWLQAVYIALMAAAVMAVAGVIRRRIVLQTLSNIFTLIRHVQQRGLRPHETINVSNPALVRVPFGAAAAIGMAYAIIMR
jgi:prepilin peptidase CpaA